MDAIEYRNAHKDESEDIASHVFNRTHPKVRLSFAIAGNIDRLRNEFGALEAPGMPEDDKKDADLYVDELWVRLLDLVNNVRKKGQFKDCPGSFAHQNM